MLKDDVSELKSMMSTILELGNPNLRERHWENIFKLIKMQYRGADTPFDLATLIKAGIMDFKDQVGDISGTSSGEAQLEQSLAKVTKAWETLSFVVLNHRDQHNLFILGSLEEIFATLEDNQVTLMTMLGSRFH